MRTTFTKILILVLSFLFAFSKPTTINADFTGGGGNPCNGVFQTVNYTASRCIYNPIADSYSCGSQSLSPSVQCEQNASGNCVAVVGYNTNCIINNSVALGGPWCIESNLQTVMPACGSSPTPPPGPGTPPPATPPPGSCSGPCMPPAANCGVYGRPAGVGSCSGGQLCCGNVGGGPSCSISANPVSVNAGRTTPYTVNIASVGGGSVTSTYFYIANPAIASVTNPGIFNANPAPNGSYTTTLTGVTPGTTTINASVYMNGALPPAAPTCSTFPDQQVSVLNSRPFYSILGNGDILSRAGNIRSEVPAGNRFLNGNGLPVFTGSIYTGSGSVSQTNQLVNTTYSGKTLSYAELSNLIPTAVEPLVQNINNAHPPGNYFENVASATPDALGYSWFRRTGDMTIMGDINLPIGRKVIVFVDGQVGITGRINYQSRPGSFFMLIARNHITIAPTVTNGANPALEGVFITDQTFTTSTAMGTPQDLRVRGAIYASNILLLRDAGGATASEYFEFDPNIYTNYPTSLTPKKTIWAEAAP